MNALKTGVLMAMLMALLMGLGWWLGGQRGLIVGFGFALISNFIAYWFSDKIALMMGRAREVSEAEAPELYAIVARLSQRAGLPMPRVYIADSPQPNAFATGRDPEHSAVAATTAILQMLSPDELEGVLAHELSHVKHRDVLISSIAATIAGTIGFVASMARWGMMFGGYGYGRDDRDRGNPLLILVGTMVAGLAATLIQLAISRSREYAADQGGGELSGKPLALASALARIERGAERMPMNVNPAAAHLYIINPLGGEALRGIAALFRTHPPTEERIARLEEQAREMGQLSGGQPGWATPR